MSITHVHCRNSFVVIAGWSVVHIQCWGIAAPEQKSTKLWFSRCGHILKEGTTFRTSFKLASRHMERSQQNVTRNLAEIFTLFTPQASPKQETQQLLWQKFALSAAWVWWKVLPTRATPPIVMTYFRHILCEWDVTFPWFHVDCGSASCLESLARGQQTYPKDVLSVVSRLSEELQGPRFWPDFDWSDFDWPDSDLKSGSSGQGEKFGGGRGQRGRSSCEGPVAPPASLDCSGIACLCLPCPEGNLD